jgi:hypothetical protein
MTRPSIYCAFLMRCMFLPARFCCLRQVLRDLFLALGVSEQQVLPLEVDSLNCGGNARCSMELTQRLGLKPQKVLMIQVCSETAGLDACNHATGTAFGM